MSKLLKVILGIAVYLIIFNNTAFAIENSTIVDKEGIPTEFSLSDINSTRSPIPDSCVYPSVYEIDNVSSFQIRGNYAALINVSEEAAINASLSFIEKAFPAELTLGLRTVGPEEGYWPGAPALITDYWPRWAMTIVSDNLRAGVYVNALSGKIVKFTLSFYNTSVGSYTPLQSVEEAESLVLDFFELHNYTLLPDAVYDGASLLSQPNNPFYSVLFHQEINQTLISFSEIHFKIDSTYGIVERFSYRWIAIERLPINRIIPADDIPRIILDSFNDSTEATVLDIDLRLEMTESSLDVPDFVMRLVYAVKVVHAVSYIYLVDALSGEILAKEPLFSAPFLIVYSPYFQVTTTLIIALLASFFSYKYLRKRKESVI